jgi:hypothetical protein
MANMIQILGGNFSKGDKAKGNFTGKDSEGQKVFIFKAQMESLGIKTDADFTPFYALVIENEIQTRDADGNISEVTAKRTEATSVFKTEEELFNAKNSSARLKIGATLNLQKTASAAGLNEVDMQTLLSAVI